MHIGRAGFAIGVGNLGIFILGAVLDVPEAMRRCMLLFSTVSVRRCSCSPFARVDGFHAVRITKRCGEFFPNALGEIVRH